MVKGAPRHSLTGKGLFWYGSVPPNHSSNSLVPMVALMAQTGQNTVAIRILLLDRFLAPFWELWLCFILSVRLKWDFPPHRHFYLPAGRIASCHRSVGFRTLLTPLGRWRGTWTTTKTGSCPEPTKTCPPSPKMHLRKGQMWNSIGERERGTPMKQKEKAWLMV